MQADEVRSRQYATVARAIAFIRAHAGAQPSLEEIAAAVHLSPAHLQRVFAAWAGISPKRFLQYLTKEYARRQLAAAGDVLSVSAAAGFGSGSRLHDLMVSCEAMTPGEIGRGGRGIDIGYGVAPTPFGPALVAWTARGVCHFAFCVDNGDDEDDDEATMLAALAANWPEAQLHADAAQACALTKRIFPETPTPGRLHLVLRGTNFQIKVWEALIRIEPGRLVSYSQLARGLGMPRASRTVGSAIAANTIAFLIPCHRVIREGGEAGQYRWGGERKLAMIGWEAGRAEGGDAPGAS
ncbi:MAG: methylated-DNA--[protein]-cysteine S-methyltransferase [Thauera phenolivorans]|uniref:Methylated-DNA--[protein]-cysteine S-methyltransferase n=1 Tax=Thauera phenolivorans TaxID=1792543 RepID=A0A7X7R6S8_9RHOO|nr:methylated-DNA--[protein]-cysteine S-methyltransferase [Thauera phenolivorans]